MTTYNEIAGRRVNFLSSDPTYVDTNTNGQVWYNSTSATLKAWLPTGAWSSGGTMNTARGLLGGAGTQTAGLGIAGYLGGGSYTAATEKYNGIAWTSNPTGVNTPRGFIGACGTQTAALAVGGYGPAATSAVESWNGSIWTSTTSLPSVRYGVLAVGTQTAALAVNGQNPLPAGLTTSWNGSAWTALPGITNTTRGYLMGFGTQTAAVAAGGRIFGPGGASNASESWNGSTWTNTPNINTARFNKGGLGAGTQTSGLIFGGTLAPGLTGATEKWNGTSWTSNPTGLATARSNLAGFGSSSSALAVGGETPSVTGATEEWNIGVYSYTAAAWASGGNMPVGIEKM